MRLTPRAHDRDVAGLTYVYPVVSRRARGVSLGINLNPNSACNWRCVYCQVPGLVFGRAPEIDLARLAEELDGMLAALVRGDYMERHVPEGSRVLRDVAFSGNGEPTSSPQFPEAVELAGRALARYELLGKVQLVLITNGSLLQLEHVRAGIARMAPLGGRVWFKLDSATDAGQARMNDAHAGALRTERNLRACAELCPTWIQTMALARGGEPPSEEERAAYLALLSRVVAERVPLEGVLLYGLERVSHQPEAPELSALPRAWMEAWGERIRAATGLPVQLSP